VFEMNTGQMVEDVRISVGEQATVHFYGRPGGIISTPREIADAITRLIYNYDLDGLAT
jgi:2-oxoglutarate ferredoxin oxidoreductase subunit alpha